MIKILLPFLFFSFVLSQGGRIEVGNNIAFTILDIAVTLTVLVSSIKIFREKKYGLIVGDPLFKPFAIFISVAVISLLLTPLSLQQSEYLTSFLYLLRWVLYSSTYFLIKAWHTNEKRILVAYMIFTGIALVVVGFIQFLLYPDLRNLYYLGWDDHLLRMFGTFFDPNFFGAFLVLILIFLVDIMSERFVNKKSASILLLLLITIITCIAIFLTYSRTALLMLLVGLVTYFILKNARRILFLYIIGVIGIGILFFSDELEGQNLFRVASTKARVESAEHALQIITTYPLLGVGFNTYRYAQIAFGFRNASPAIESHADAGTDNSYLFILATTGIVGFLAYIFYIFTLVRNIWERGGKKELLIASFASVLIGTMFINILFYPAIILWLFLLIRATQST